MSFRLIKLFECFHFDSNLFALFYFFSIFFSILVFYSFSIKEI